MAPAFESIPRNRWGYDFQYDLNCLGGGLGGQENSFFSLSSSSSSSCFPKPLKRCQRRITQHMLFFGQVKKQGQQETAQEANTKPRRSTTALYKAQTPDNRTTFPSGTADGSGTTPELVLQSPSYPNLIASRLASPRPLAPMHVMHDTNTKPNAMSKVETPSQPRTHKYIREYVYQT